MIMDRLVYARVDLCMMFRLGIFTRAGLGNVSCLVVCVCVCVCAYVRACVCVAAQHVIFVAPACSEMLCADRVCIRREGESTIVISDLWVKHGRYLSSC